MRDYLSHSSFNARKTKKSRYKIRLLLLLTVGLLVFLYLRQHHDVTQKKIGETQKITKPISLPKVSEDSTEKLEFYDVLAQNKE